MRVDYRGYTLEARTEGYQTHLLAVRSDGSILVDKEIQTSRRPAELISALMSQVDRAVSGSPYHSEARAHYGLAPDRFTG